MCFARVAGMWLVTAISVAFVIVCIHAILTLSRYMRHFIFGTYRVVRSRQLGGTLVAPGF